MAIRYRQVDAAWLPCHDAIPMQVEVGRILRPEKIDGGYGGICLHEVAVPHYTKDYRRFGTLTDFAARFDTRYWAFFMAFDGERAVAAAAVVSRTVGIRLLRGRTDLAVLWDLRVAPDYQRQGIGSRLFERVLTWCRREGLRQLKIETQNVNIPACRFYRSHGAQLAGYDEYAYTGEVRGEIQLLWYLDLPSA